LSAPSITELRAVTQPQSLLDRPGAEHWAGRLYMRRLSPHLTRLLIPTPLTANGLTALMVPTGLLAALALSFGGVWTAVVSVLLVQVQLLLDCADGELARWRRTFSSAGVYLDQIAHYTTEAALPAALGVRADGGWDSIGGWTALGLAASALIVLLKAETHLVLFARVRAGVAPVEAADEERPPVRAQRLRVREGARLLPFFRPFHAIEATLLALAAAIADAAAGELVGSRVLVALLASGALVAAAGHLAAVLASNRLR
jgi:phosphatidylglycerophosphate synthase